MTLSLGLNAIDVAHLKLQIRITLVPKDTFPRQKRSLWSTNVDLKQLKHLLLPLIGSQAFLKRMAAPPVKSHPEQLSRNQIAGPTSTFKKREIINCE